MQVHRVCAHILWSELSNSSTCALDGSADAQLSAVRDPWPLNPSDGNTSREFRGYLWYSGWVAAIHVSRISSYYVIYAVLPVALSTLLSLLVFAINPRHLDTR